MRLSALTILFTIMASFCLDALCILRLISTLEDILTRHKLMDKIIPLEGVNPDMDGKKVLDTVKDYAKAMNKVRIRIEPFITLLRVLNARFDKYDSKKGTHELLKYTVYDDQVWDAAMPLLDAWEESEKVRTKVDKIFTLLSFRTDLMYPPALKDWATKELRPLIEATKVSLFNDAISYCKSLRNKELDPKSQKMSGGDVKDKSSARNRVIQDITRCTGSQKPPKKKSRQIVKPEDVLSKHHIPSLLKVHDILALSVCEYYNVSSMLPITSSNNAQSQNPN